MSGIQMTPEFGCPNFGSLQYVHTKSANFQSRKSSLDLLWEFPDSYASKYDEAQTVFRLAKMAEDRIRAAALHTTNNEPLIFEVGCNSSRLYKHLIYFECQILKPTTHDRVGKMNKRRLDILTKLQASKFDWSEGQRIIILQVKVLIFA